MCYSTSRRDITNICYDEEPDYRSGKQELSLSLKKKKIGLNLTMCGRSFPISSRSDSYLNL